MRRLWASLPPEKHLVRAWLSGPGAVVVALVFGWQASVFYVLCMSGYANFASDLSAYQGAKAKLAAEENSSSK